MDDTTDLDAAPAHLDGAERALAGALTRALDARPADTEQVVDQAQGLLGAVERRAGRRHRRRRAVTAGGTVLGAALVAVAVALPTAGLGAGRSAQRGAGALGPPPVVTAPPPVDPSGDQWPLLSRQEVEALLPGTSLVDASPPLQLGENRGYVDQGSLCTAEGVSSTPGRGSDAFARWVPARLTSSTALRSVQDRKFTFADVDGASALVAAVAATTGECRPPSAMAWPLTVDGRQGELGIVATGQGRWRVHVVAAVGATVVDVSAELAARDAATARDLVLGVWRAAAARVPRADRDPPPQAPVTAAQQAEASAAASAATSRAAVPAAPRTPSMVTHGPDPRE